MLAVCGAVEAARAGEAGRGFAVVAGDIRGLSREAAAHAGRMQDMVREVQMQTAVARRDLEQIVLAGQGEARRNHLLLARLGEARDAIEALRGGAEETASGAEAAMQAAREVLDGCRQIAAAAVQIGGSTAQAAAAAREQAQGTEALAAAIEEIAGLAEELQGTEG
ncbi:methyl-accepting chemotaxis protein [Teichococcus aestuarii]